MASNRSHLFPVKLITMLRRLQDTGALDKISGSNACSMKGLNCPDDGLRRLSLMSPELHWAVEHATGMQYLRKRMTLPHSTEMKDLHQAKLEYYDETGALACEPVQLTELDATISLAVEVELMAHMLDAVQQGIPML